MKREIRVVKTLPEVEGVAVSIVEDEETVIVLRKYLEDNIVQITVENKNVFSGMKYSQIKTASIDMLIEALEKLNEL